MAGGVNKVILIGNLGKDPEIKELDGGKIFAKLSLATNEKYKGESKTTWHNIVVWDEKKAEIAQLQKKSGLTAVSRENAEAELFGEVFRRQATQELGVLMRRLLMRSRPEALAS